MFDEKMNGSAKEFKDKQGKSLQPMKAVPQGLTRSLY